MDIYFSYLSLLGSALGSVAAITGWALVALVLTWLLGAWIIVILVPKASENAAPEPPIGWVWLHPAILSTGWATLVVISMASLYLTKGLFAAKLLLAAMTIAGFVLIWRNRSRFRSKSLGTFAVVGLATFLMGLWQHAATELPQGSGKDYLVFSDRHKDLPVHVTMAGLIEDSALPLVKTVPSPTRRFSEPTHVGHTVLIAAYASILGISLYAASTVTWIIATVLTGWCALGLFSRGREFRPAYAMLTVLATLVVGQFALPWSHDLSDPRTGLVTGIWVASRSYWNLSQAASIALTMGGLLILDGYCARRRQGLAQLSTLAAAVTLITIAGLVKPSLIIFYGPALIIWLALSRARMAEYLVATTVMAAGLLVYFLPRFLHPLAIEAGRAGGGEQAGGGEWAGRVEWVGKAGWRFAMDSQQWLEVASFLWYSSLSLLFFLIVLIIRWPVNGWRSRQWQVLELAAIAFGGSILFALLFSESQYVGFITFQPNLWWGICACIVLLIPLFGREVVDWLKLRGWTRWVVVLGLAVGAVQIVNGLHVAAAYPVLNLRRHELFKAETLDAARELTAPGARFALDLSLDDLDLRPFLSRPSLARTGFGSKDGKQAYSSWLKFLRNEGANPPTDRLDAVVLQRNQRRANLYFEKSGWVSTPINEKYTLWEQVMSVQ